MKIIVLYSCCGCGLHRAEAVVPAREADQDLMEWMDMLGEYLGRDHATRSPHCTEEKCHDVMIPIPGTERVGGSAVN